MSSNESTDKAQLDTQASPDAESSSNEAEKLELKEDLDRYLDYSCRCEEAVEKN